MQQEDIEVIYGIHPVTEALYEGKSIEKILFQREIKNQKFGQIIRELKEKEIPFQFVPKPKLDKYTRKAHQGIVGLIAPIRYYDVSQILINTFEKGEVPLILILDRITDVRNFGAIVRSAECGGVHAVVVPLGDTAQVNAHAFKASAGALNKVTLCREKSLPDTVRFLKNSGVQVICITEKTDKLLKEADFTVPTALILGSEGKGISKKLLDASDAKAKIPMAGTLSSLNVSVAAGIALYEVLRQRT